MIGLRLPVSSLIYERMIAMIAYRQTLYFIDKNCKNQKNNSSKLLIGKKKLCAISVKKIERQENVPQT